MQRALTLFILLFSLHSFAQKKQKVYFIKDEIPVENAADADYRRIIQEPDSGSKFFNLFEFYPNDVEKTVGHVSGFENRLIYEGLVKRYNKQGILVEESNYSRGKLDGESKSFYESGKLKSILSYNPKISIPGTVSKDYYSIILAYDSLGKQTAKDGNGYYKETGKNFSEGGNYHNNQKDGIWTGTVGEHTFEEIYKNGAFVSGKATLSNGKIYKYQIVEQVPEYNGGVSIFYRYLGREIKFSKEALILGAKGKVFVNFTIDKDGNLTDIIVKNKLGYGIEEEVIRAFKKSPKWVPGIQHGIPVKAKYSIWINFNQ